MTRPEKQIPHNLSTCYSTQHDLRQAACEYRVLPTEPQADRKLKRKHQGSHSPLPPTPSQIYQGKEGSNPRKRRRRRQKWRRNLWKETQKDFQNLLAPRQQPTLKINPADLPINILPQTRHQSPSPPEQFIEIELSPIEIEYSGSELRKQVKNYKNIISRVAKYIQGP